MSDHPLFTLASSWLTVEPSARPALREFIKSLVKYECQLDCRTNNGSVDITVFSVERQEITDWLELQSDGAIGVIFDQYHGSEPHELSDRCEDYNASIDVEFDSDSDSESSGSN